MTPTPAYNHNPDQNYTLQFPLAALESMRDQCDLASECPIALDRMVNPQSLVPCGHPMNFESAKKLFDEAMAAQKAVLCPVCKGITSAHIPNFGMKGLIEAVDNVFQRYEWTSAELQQRKEAEERRLASQTQAAVRAVAVHLGPPRPFDSSNPYPGNFSNFSLYRPWTSIGPEEGEREFVRRIACKDRTGEGLISYFRGSGRRTGEFEVMVTSTKKDQFEQHFKDLGWLRPDSEQKDDKKGERTSLTPQGTKVVMGKFIAKEPHHIKYVLEMIGAQGNVVPTESYKFLQKLAARPDNWPAVERENPGFCAEAKKQHLQNRRDALRQKGEEFGGYTPQEHALAVQQQEEFERKKARMKEDEALALKMQNEWR